MEEKPLLDLTFLGEFCRHRKPKMIQYINSFLETSPNEMIQLRRAVDSKNWQEVNTIAHSLKPQLALIGLSALRVRIEKIEKESENPVALETIDRILTDAENLFEESRNQLKETLLTLS